MRFHFSIWVLLSLLSVGCRKKTNPTPQLASGKAFVVLPDSVAEVFKARPIPPWAPKKFGYKPSRDRDWDLIHTRLEVSFHWENQTMPARAELRLKPYFFPQDSLVLDAKGFALDSVLVFDKSARLESGFHYNGRHIRIGLGRKVRREETIRVRIVYTARPNDLPQGGNAAITADRGLYFINPDGSNPDMPRQIWTQGEPEAASCWFPTIDSPNERCTQEMAIRVNDRFKTLSNGVKTGSRKEKNGERTDFWEMKLPHAPYLFMMAVGDWTVVPDRVDGIPLNYWVEPKYAPQAMRIFGKTPKMIRFFSQKLGTPFPWPKYDQVVVREFVSGAMENTSASVFMEALHSTRKELVDHSWDDIIAHELFHQWFGDLVTLESWANLPLNESFANYSQFLWDEYEYGLDEAEWNAEKEKQQYLYESTRKREPMIRYEHDQPNDMFDSHSYAKGGRLLHMLRKELGDEAFFEGLRVYLKDNAFQSVEIHHLRLAFEKVSGKDLMSFFNQWFLQAGHPELEVEVAAENGGMVIRTTQKQDTTYFPIYSLRVPVEIWTSDGCETKILHLKQASDTFQIPVSGSVLSLIWDANASVLAETNIQMPREFWANQFRVAGKAIHRFKALQKLRQDFDGWEQTDKILETGIQDPFWAIRQACLEAWEDQGNDQIQQQINTFRSLALLDPKPQVRTVALRLLGRISFDGKKELLDRAMGDSSLAASSQAFKNYLKENYPDAPGKIAQLQATGEPGYLGVLADFYATQPGRPALQWFERSLRKEPVSDGYELLQGLGKMMNLSQDSSLIMDGIRLLYDLTKGKAKPELIIGGFQVLKAYQNWPGVREMRRAIRKEHPDGELGEILEYLE